MKCRNCGVKIKLVSGGYVHECCDGTVWYYCRNARNNVYIESYLDDRAAEPVSREENIKQLLAKLDDL